MCSSSLPPRLSSRLTGRPVPPASEVAFAPRGVWPLSDPLAGLAGLLVGKLAQVADVAAAGDIAPAGEDAAAGGGVELWVFEPVDVESSSGAPSALTAPSADVPPEPDDASSVLVDVSLSASVVERFADCVEARQWWWSVDEFAPEAVAVAVVYDGSSVAGSPEPGRFVYVVLRDKSAAWHGPGTSSVSADHVALHHWLRRVAKVPSVSVFPPVSPPQLWALSNATVAVEAWSWLRLLHAPDGPFASAPAALAWVERLVACPTPVSWQTPSWDEAYRREVVRLLRETAPGAASVSVDLLRHVLWCDAPLWAWEQAADVLSPAALFDRLDREVGEGRMPRQVAELIASRSSVG